MAQNIIFVHYLRGIAVGYIGGEGVGFNYRANQIGLSVANNEPLRLFVGAVLPRR